MQAVIIEKNLNTLFLFQEGILAKSKHESIDF